MKKNLRRAILLTAAVVSPAAALPATAWAAPVPPVVGVSLPSQGILGGGRPGDVDVTVGEATSSDAFLRLLLTGDVGSLRITDDAGNSLPSVPVVNGMTVDVGSADSDGNGIPGAPLVDGTVHLHIAAPRTARDYQVDVTAFAVDGTTGNPTGRSDLGKDGRLFVRPPFFPSWQAPGSSAGGYGGEVPIVGGPELTTLDLQSNTAFLRSSATTARMVLPASRLVAAGYDPDRFAAQVQVSYSTDGVNQTPLAWIVKSDGSLELDLPAPAVPDGAAVVHQQLRFRAPWTIAHGSLTADLTLSAANGAVLGTSTQDFVVNPGPAPITYHPLTPARVLDTRNRTGVPGTVPLAPGATLSLAVGGIPSTATAAVLNVTVTAPTQQGFLAVHPPVTDVTGSSLNWTAGQTIANQVITPIRGATILLTNHSGGTVHVVADLEGYYTALSPQGSGYTPVPPTRVLDTRTGTGTTAGTPGTVPAGTSITLPIPGLPANATAVTVNLTATAATAAGYITAYPHGHTEPNASNLNWTPGETIPNLVTIPVTDGKIILHNRSAGTVQLVADLEGFFSTTPDTNAFIPRTPTRVLDTRARTGVPTTTPLAPGASITLPLTGLGLDTATNGHNAVNAVALNVTVTSPTADGFLSVQPAGTTTTASNLNWTRGQTIANLVIVRTANEAATFTNHSSGTVHVVADASGIYTH